MLFIKSDPEAIIPKKQTNGAAAFDLHCNISGVIKSKNHSEISTGIKLNTCLMKKNKWFGEIFGRSGLAVRNGLEVRGSVVDEEMFIYIFNNGNVDFEFNKGERIAQLVIFDIA